MINIANVGTESNFSQQEHQQKHASTLMFFCKNIKNIHAHYKSEPYFKGVLRNTQLYLIDKFAFLFTKVRAFLLGCLVLCQLDTI